MRKRFACVAVAAALALAALPAPAPAREGWRRLAGQGALDTMAAVVRADGAFTAEGVDAVVVATSEGYWDALAASGLAGRLRAPVLITPTGSLAPQTRSEIERLRPSTVYVAGGPLAVSEKVVSELRGLCGRVVRLSGQSAVDTAYELWRGAGSPAAETAIVASSAGYWDALSVAPYAYRTGSPVFLAGPAGRLGDAQRDAIVKGGFERVLVVGGTLAVSADVDAEGGQLAGFAGSVERVWGQDALDTSAEVAKWSLGHGLSADDLFVATSDGYWDALTGAALAGAKGSALILVHPEGGVKAYAALRKATGRDLSCGTVLGGELAVSAANYAYLESGGSDMAAVRAKLDEFKARGEAIDAQIKNDQHIYPSLRELAQSAGVQMTRYTELMDELLAYLVALPEADAAKLRADQESWQRDMDASWLEMERQMAQNPYSGYMYQLNKAGDRITRTRARVNELLSYGYGLV